MYEYRFIQIYDGPLLPAERPLPPPRRPRRDALPRALGAGLAAIFDSLTNAARAGQGPNAWGPPLFDDPLAFLLDAVSDPVILRDIAQNTVVLNRAARNLGAELPQEPTASAVEHLQVGGCPFVRRTLRLKLPGRVVTLEILSKQA